MSVDLEPFFVLRTHGLRGTRERSSFETDNFEVEVIYAVPRQELAEAWIWLALVTGAIE
jgi:hypothetical protein